MPQRKQVTWAQLRVGTLVLVSLAILAVGIFFISGQVGILGRRYTLKSYFTGARGLREGAQVRLAGIGVGNVERIEISPYPERERAVEVVMRVRQAIQNQIRVDSVATLETVGLLGESYVDITRGSPGQEVIPEGGVVKSSEEADIKAVVQNANDVISNLRVLSAKLNDITNQVQHGQGSMGKLIYDDAFYNRLNETTGGMQRLVARVERGEGALGKLVSDETLYNRTVATLDRLNQVVDEVQHGKGSIAKFMSDPALYDNVNKVVTRGNELMDRINEGQGTLGKLATDPQLYNRVNETFDRMNIISTRIEQGQGTLGKLSTDPTLFNNLSESSQSLKDFLTEFRKNPKKYMSLRVRLF
jgi:phospholipid/cholesterol/gamma-HCH transport system substrate-binding protein